MLCLTNFQSHRLMKRILIKSPFKLIFWSGFSGVFSACSNIPDEPGSQAAKATKEVVIPTRFDAQSGTRPTPEIAKGLLSLFSDTQLKKYVNLSLVNNPDLKTTLAQLEEADFNTNVAYAAKRPTLTGNSSVGGTRSRGENSRTTSASLDVAWEIDVWGRIRAGVRATQQDREALASDYEAAQESIAAQTMQAYFTLISSEQLLELSSRRLASFEETEALVNRRFEAGTGDLSELSLARTDVESTRAEIEGRKDDRDQAARQLKLLTGSYPDARFSANSYPSLRRSVPAGVPSTVMMNRPDIYAAYQRILAADSRVTVAHRDFYPDFSLTASSGRQSNSLQGLGSSNFSVWSLLANLSTPIIDGGERRSELGAANARAKQALSDYKSVVLSAFEEVENALGAEYYLKQQQVAFERALKAAKQAEAQTQRNFESGLSEVLTLLDAKRRSFTAEEALINTKAQRYDNRVSLALALGKGL